MKKRVLCFLALALFLLTACTMLSAKIEQEMATAVTVYRVEPKEAGRYEINLPVRFLFLEDERIYVDELDMKQLSGLQGDTLYQLEERKGWDSGLRVWEVDKSDYHINPMDAVLSGFDETRGWTFVSCASRHPRPGQMVEILEDGQTEQDSYLVLYPGAAPSPRQLPDGVAVAARDSGALLLRLDQAPAHFLEKRARSQIGDFFVSGCRIFSMNDVDRLIRNLPRAAGVGMILLAALALFAQALCLLDRENRFWLWADALLAVGLLGALWLVLRDMDLPPSLLPPENILDMGHYEALLSPVLDALRVFSRDLFASMRALGRTGQNTLNLLYRTTLQVRRTALWVGALAALWMSLPWVLRDRQTTIP